MSDSARSGRTGIGRRAALWLGVPMLLAAACADTRPDPPAAWPLACSFFPPQGEAVPDCARRGPDGEIVLRAGVLPGDSEPTAVETVIVEGELLFALASGRTAPALFYDNGPDYFVEGLARSPRDGKVGFVNERLELVVPREWDFAFPFEHGLARVCTGCAIRRQGSDEHAEVAGGRWGYVNRGGRFVVPVVHAPDELPAPSPGPSDLVNLLQDLGGRRKPTARDHERSKRSRFITLSQAATKSRTNASRESSQA